MTKFKSNYSISSITKDYPSAEAHHYGDFDDCIKLKLKDNEVSAEFDDKKFESVFGKARILIIKEAITDTFAELTPKGVLCCWGETHEITKTFTWDYLCYPECYTPEYAGQMAKTFDKLAADFHKRSLEKED